jgi:hypothetical protein
MTDIFLSKTIKKSKSKKIHKNPLETLKKSTKHAKNPENNVKIKIC